MNHNSIIKKHPKTKRGKITRNKLLAAAETEFGEKGYHPTAISDITQRAGVALGTFYVYFHSKNEIFRALVSHMGHRTREWVAKKTEPSSDRVTTEQRALEAFIDFVLQNGQLYRIVAEAQFVAEDAFCEYYREFVEVYMQELESAHDKNQIRQADYEVWAWALMGMNSFLGMRFAHWDNTRSPNDIAAIAADLLRYGMPKR